MNSRESAEWARRDDNGQQQDAGTGWYGRVVYGLVDVGGVVLIETWVPAEHLHRAGP